MAGRLEYRCRCCGEIHEGLPAFVCEAPDYYNGVPEAERQRRCHLTSDTLVLDDEHFFIRGTLGVPILGSSDHFDWGVWTSLSEANFQRYLDIYGVEDVGEEGPYFGWFSNALPFYPDTMNLRLLVHPQNGGIRPLLELEPTDHPLSIDQREGVSRDRAVEMAEKLLHPEAASPPARDGWLSRLAGRLRGSRREGE